MIIFVDYDNIDRIIVQHGVTHVVNRILSKIDPQEISNNKRVRIRFYGGWYEQNRFTTRAQVLSTSIINSYPNVGVLSDNLTKVIVQCEMAYSILADPTNHLFNTYRSRGIPSGLKVKHPSSCGCLNTNCGLISTFDFVSNNICQQCGVLKPKDLFFRGEQKLIDTMLTSDIIFSSTQNATIIVVVSSDDDFWPGIKTTLVNGKKVIHLHTRSRMTPPSYTRTTNSNYIQKTL